MTVTIGLAYSAVLSDALAAFWTIENALITCIDKSHHQAVCADTVLFDVRFEWNKRGMVDERMQVVPWDGRAATSVGIP